LRQTNSTATDEEHSVKQINLHHTRKTCNAVYDSVSSTRKQDNSYIYIYIYTSVSHLSSSFGINTMRLLIEAKHLLQ